MEKFNSESEGYQMNVCVCVGEAMYSVPYVIQGRLE